MPGKKLYFGTNLKMYKGIRETVSYLCELEQLTADMDPENVQLFVIPSYTSLPDAIRSLRHKQILLGAQNMCWEEQGQFTGEISPLMLRELGISIIELGHSERRHIFGETNVMINRKVITGLKSGFTVLLCIGETEEEKNWGISDETLRIQLKTGLNNIPPDFNGRLLIAYEPVWAIGVNGQPASVEYARDKHELIRSTLCEIAGSAGKDIPLLYGGSVNPSNSDELILQPEVDGLFVGRSAWNASDFNALIRSAIHSAARKQHYT
ncbi:triosephosphate isomerase [Lachnospiraceae bacterium NLAE-zl-G231]|uniref:Triosephosphate isomerase n=1 Tax=Eisenbergiella tayi TaxID=1432052 RepID=A0A1E3AIT2_9FIRM|nr:triose-phosphate isomerase [Eisenbergiella tayi]ODM08653.1 Bifunctional PGK/TIM [Eisenbergiella tayi]SFH19661.1 triosephosphate isomerase [Lachnospiraceae bacterium NLAE-zl-G231]